MSASDNHREPLVYTGTLDAYKSFDVTPVIGREFPDLQLSSLLGDDAKIRDLAVLASQRGVIFFRNQDLRPLDQRNLVQKLGQLTGKPSTSQVHRHAVQGKSAEAEGNKKLPDGEPRPDEVLVLSSDNADKSQYKDHLSELKPLASSLWHADITFENVPSDYAVLKMNVAPETGGDTIWASAYEAYDRLSPAWKKLAESLTATHVNVSLQKAAQEVDADYITENRGTPENHGLDFTAVHPVIRTNPVTGWKSLMAAGHQVQDGKFNDVTPREDQILKSYFLQLVAENHDLQVRFRWNKNDIAVWDNRACFHTATFDHNAKREASRYVSIGERPYLDPKSLSRRQALAKL